MVAATLVSLHEQIHSTASELRAASAAYWSALDAELAAQRAYKVAHAAYVDWEHRANLLALTLDFEGKTVAERQVRRDAYLRELPERATLWVAEEAAYEERERCAVECRRADQWQKALRAELAAWTALAGLRD